MGRPKRMLEGRKIRKKSDTGGRRAVKHPEWKEDEHTQYNQERF